MKSRTAGTKFGRVKFEPDDEITELEIIGCETLATAQPVECGRRLPVVKKIITVKLTKQNVL